VNYLPFLISSPFMSYPWDPIPNFPHDDNISRKPVPRWPHRASYRTQVRNARRRRNIEKRGAK
jgi:hypothetical protein